MSRNMENNSERLNTVTTRNNYSNSGTFFQLRHHILMTNMPRHPNNKIMLAVKYCKRNPAVECTEYTHCLPNFLRQHHVFADFVFSGTLRDIHGTLAVHHYSVITNDTALELWSVYQCIDAKGIL